MALSAPSNLSLDINISGDAPKVAQSTAEQLQKAEQNAKRLNDRLKEQIAYMRELKSFNISKQDALGVRDADLVKQKQAIANLRADQQARIDLTKAAKDENTESLKRLKLMQEQEGRVGMLGQAWGKFGMIFTRVLDALIAFKIIQWISELFQLFTTHVIEVSETFEKLQVRLYTLNPSLEQTAKIWREITSVTVTSPFKIAEVGQAAVMLRTFGVSAVENLRAVSDWATAVEKDLTDVSVAFGKIVNRSPRTNLMLSTRGLSEGGYEKYLEEYRDRAIALQKYLDDTFGGTAARISETFYGLKTNISDLFDIMQQKAGKPIFDRLKDDLNYIQSILKDINKGSGGETAGFLANLIPDAILRKAAMSNLIDEMVLLRTMMVDVSSGVPEYYPLDNAKQELARLERMKKIFQLLGLNLSLEDQIMAYGRDGRLVSSLDKRIVRQRELVKLANQELLIKNSSFGLISRYELQASMKENPELLKFLRSTMPSDKSGNVFQQSAHDMIATLTTVVSKKEAMARLEKDIKATIASRPKDDEDIVRWGIEREQTLKDQIQQWITLFKLIKEHKDKVKDYSEEISRLQERFQNLIEQNYLRQQQMERNIIKSGYDRGSISSSDYSSTLQGRLSQLQSDYASKMSDMVAEKGRLLTMPMQTGEQQVKYLEQEIRIADIDKERLRVWQEMLEIQEEMYKLPSQTFGDALNKQLLQAKKTLDSIHDTLVTVFLDMGREFSKGLITEVLFGTRGKELTSQIDDLRFQLIQMNIDKNNTLDTATKVKLIEDQEVSLLARINDLERQRSQIILTLLTDISKKMLDKLEDQAINALFSLAGGLFGNAQPSGFTTSDYYSTHVPRWKSNNMTPLLPSSTPSSRSVVVQFTGNVYGGREFKDQVQTAIVEINRNIR